MVIVPLQDAQARLNARVWSLAGGTLGLTLLAAATVWFIAGRVLRPVEAIRSEFAELSAHHLDRRVPVPRAGSEIARLATTMNTTLDRLQTAVDRQRQFTADASHELRTPLACLRTELELASSRPDTADWPQVVDDALGDAIRLQDLTDDLLLLARLDAGHVLRQDTFVMADVVRDAIADRTVRVWDSSGGRPIRGSRVAMRRLITNLIDNATRYARSAVTVRLWRGADRLIVEITDDGPGIDAENRRRVFDRFVRLDEARTRTDGGGTGLGLAIAREIAVAHEGTLTAEAPEPGHPGARLVLTLPADR